MELELASLFAADGTLPVDYAFDISDTEPFVGEVSVKGEVLSHAGLVEFKGCADFTYSRPCDRCAKVIPKAMKQEFFHTLVTSSDSEDSDLVVLDGTKFCPDELIREDVILNLPWHYLCKEDCKGLCEKCGKDLNEGPCSCPKTHTDERFAVLKELL